MGVLPRGFVGHSIDELSHLHRMEKIGEEHIDNFYLDSFLGKVQTSIPPVEKKWEHSCPFCSAKWSCDVKCKKPYRVSCKKCEGEGFKV